MIFPGGTRMVRHEAQRSASVREWGVHVFMAPIATREDSRDVHFSIDRASNVTFDQAPFHLSEILKDTSSSFVLSDILVAHDTRQAAVRKSRLENRSSPYGETDKHTG